MTHIPAAMAAFSLSDSQTVLSPERQITRFVLGSHSLVSRSFPSKLKTLVLIESIAAV